MRVTAAQVRAGEEISQLASLAIARIAINRTVRIVAVRYSAQRRIRPKSARRSATRLMQNVVNIDRPTGISKGR